MVQVNHDRLTWSRTPFPTRGRRTVDADLGWHSTATPGVVRFTWISPTGIRHRK